MAGVSWASFSCVPGVQQQLPVGCTDQVAARQHSQAGPDAHAGAADGGCASRGRDAPRGAGDDGPSGGTQVSCFCSFILRCLERAQALPKMVPGAKS